MKFVVTDHFLSRLIVRIDTLMMDVLPQRVDGPLDGCLTIHTIVRKEGAYVSGGAQAVNSPAELELLLSTYLRRIEC